MLKVGDKAPDFRLIGTSGHAVTLKELRGRKVVLYFYPRDDTPGCTREACAFRDSMARLRRAGVDVLGVSKDSLASHERFRTKYELPFELLSDPDSSVATAYGAYGTKTMYGKKVQGTIRSTFLIDEKGRVAVVWSPVKVDGHVDQVLEALGAGAPTATGAAARKKVAKKTVRKKAAKKAGTRKRSTRKAVARATSKAGARKKAPARKKAATRRKAAARRPARKA
jgi:peroxiredoxin Q/BCP